MRRARRPSPAPLRPIAFGEKTSSYTTDPIIAAENSARALPCLRAFEPTGERESFAIRSADVRIGDLTLVANAASEMITRADGGKGLVFIFSLGGNCTIADSAGVHDLQSDNNAILVHNSGHRETRAENRSLVVAKLDAQRLNHTISAMAGGDALRAAHGYANVNQNFSTRKLTLRHGDFDFSKLFRRTFDLIDSVYDNQHFLEALRLDEMIYRNIAALLEPRLVLGGPRIADRVRDSNEHATEIVCDAIRGNTGRMLTLTEMEHLSGLSRRALQYAFRKRFEMSPMEWQKHQKLAIARQKIMESDINTNITTLSYDLGFTKPSSFAAYYRRLFGERPSDTRQRARL